MTKTQKNWLISLLAITLVGGATLGLVLPLTMCSVNPTPGPTPPPGPINNDLKPIGNYNESATADLEHPIVYIDKDKNKDDANVLRFMEIQAGSNLETTYGCSGWTVFGTKIETTNSDDTCFDVDINVNTIPETVLINGTKQKIKNIGRFSSNTNFSLIIPNFIEAISKNAFEDCLGLNGSLLIPMGINYVGQNAFNGCLNLTNLNLSNATSLTDIKQKVFNNCSSLVGNLTIPNNIISIGQNAFANCSSLTSLDLLNATSLTTISRLAFDGCSNLSGVLTIPENVTYIENFAFGKNFNFNKIEVDSKNAKFGLATNLGSNGYAVLQKKRWIAF